MSLTGLGPVNHTKDVGTHHPQARTQVPPLGPTQPRLWSFFIASFSAEFGPDSCQTSAYVHRDGYLLPRNSGEQDTVLVLKDKQ